jgi:hypothetical protein
MPVTDPKTVKNRLYLDLASSAHDREQEIERLLASGARRVGIGQTGAESWTVLADPEGKRVLRDTPEGNAHPVRLALARHRCPVRGYRMYCLGFSALNSFAGSDELLRISKGHHRGHVSSRRRVIYHRKSFEDQPNAR